MAYAVECTTAARRQFRKVPRPVRAMVKPEIDALTSDPRPHGVEKMSGEENAYRVRVGDYRIIYEIHDAVLIVVVVRVGHRPEAYQ